MTDTARRLRELAPRQQSIEDSRTLERAARDLETTRAYLENEQKQNAILRGKASALREAQKAYMADRGNDTLGQAVGAAAKDLDYELRSSSNSRKSSDTEDSSHDT